MKKQNPKTSLIIYFSFIMIFLKKSNINIKWKKRKTFFCRKRKEKNIKQNKTTTKNLLNTQKKRIKTNKQKKTTENKN